MTRDLASFVVGEKVDWTHTFSGLEVDRYAVLIGDVNDLHVSDAYAREAGFSGRVVHGMLSASLFSRVVGMQLPGEKALYLSQTLRFHVPILVGETVRVVGTITEIHQVMRVMTLETSIYKQDGRVAVSGTAKVFVRE